jgi:hypothetical protein
VCEQVDGRAKQEAGRLWCAFGSESVVKEREKGGRKVVKEMNGG